MAPADVPIKRSGRKPRSCRAASMPTCTEPRLPPPERTNAVVIAGSSAPGSRRERGGEASQRQRAEEKPEVAEGDVVVVRHHEQVDDDAAEPRGHEVAAEAWAECDGEAGDDLDGADDVHDVVRARVEQVADLGRE